MGPLSLNHTPRKRRARLIPCVPWGRKRSIGSDVHNRLALRRPAGQGVHRGVPRGLHLRGRAHALYPPGRVRRLRRLRAGLPGRGHLLRGRRARTVEGLLPGQRRLLPESRLAGRRVQDRQDRPGSPAGGIAATATALTPTAGRRHPAPTCSARLPRFPWDALEPYKARALAHPGGLVDLSVGTPVDPFPARVPQALEAPSNPPAYPPPPVPPTPPHPP